MALHQYCHNKSKGGSRPTSHIPYPLGLQFFLLYLFLTLHALSQLYSTVCLHSTTWFFCFYFFPSATLKKKIQHEADKVHQRIRAVYFVSGRAEAVGLFAHVVELSHQPGHLRQVSGLSGCHGLENSWGLDVTLMFFC